VIYKFIRFLILRGFVGRIWVRLKMLYLRNHCDSAGIVHFNVSHFGKHTRLCALSQKYGSDKGGMSPYSDKFPWRVHDYTIIYDLLLRPKASSARHIVECGIGSNNAALPSSMGPSAAVGASLRMWREYFYDATIYGLDVDPDTLFEDDRIQTYCVDQLNQDSVQAFVESAGLNGSIDVVIDDGLHTFDAAISLLKC
jgi:hypothetical protein